MPIDVAAALSAEPTVRELRWSDRDVLLYHLSLGAGAYRTDPDELRWTYERDLQVLPTFAVVAGGRLVDADVGQRMRLPGIDVDLARVLHAGEAVTVHAPIPAAANGRATSKVSHIWDKGKAALIIAQTAVSDSTGTPLWTTTSQIWVRGEGGFGGEPGPDMGWAPPERRPDIGLDSPTSIQTALLYRLNGDRNPLHVDPEFAAAAGFDRPILHGLASYGIVCKALIDAVLGGDARQVREYSARFAGVLHPGETIRTRVWRDGERLILHASCPQRRDSPVLTHAMLTVGDGL